MRIRSLPALVPALLALTVVPASAATHGKVQVAYTRTPDRTSGELVAYACAGAGLGFPTSWSCSVSPATPGPVPAPATSGVVAVTGTYTITVRLSVRALDGRGYSCTNSVTLTVGGPPAAGTFGCTA